MSDSDTHIYIGKLKVYTTYIKEQINAHKAHSVTPTIGATAEIINISSVDMIKY